MTTPPSEAIMDKPLVVNLLSGPGAGKSTLAAMIFSQIKMRSCGLTVELAVEFAKELVWEGRKDALANQIYVLGEQFQRIERVAGKADIVVTDSPVLFSAIYAPPHFPDGLVEMALWCHNRFPSLNVLVERPPDYDPAGRLHTHGEALEVDRRTMDFVDRHNIVPVTHARSVTEDASRIADAAIAAASGESGSGRPA